MDSRPTCIGIIGWSVYRISGTGSIVRTLLQGLNDNLKVKFIVALPTPPKNWEISQSISLLPNINKLTSLVIPTSTETIQPWLETAYKILAPKIDVIFYPDSIVFPCQKFSKSFPLNITLLHDVLPLTLPEYYLNPFKYWDEKKKFLSIANNSDKVITISEYSRKMIQKKINISKKKIHLIPNGIDPVFYNSHLPKGTNRRGILYVGDFRRRKNVLSLVQAYLQLNISIREKHPLILVADGKLKSNIMRRFRHTPSQIIFRLQLSQSNLKNEYLQAKVFVFPSLQEGFGLPVIEAQHNGVPVVCSNHTALSEITNSSVYHVNVRKPKEITRAITILINDSKLYQSYQEKGFVNSTRFTANRMVNSYQKFFETISENLPIKN